MGIFQKRNNLRYKVEFTNRTNSKAGVCSKPLGSWAQPGGKTVLQRNIWLKAGIIKLTLLVLIWGVSFITISSQSLGADDFAAPDQLEYANIDLRDIFRDLAGIGKFKVLFAHEFQEKASMIIESGSLLKQTTAEIALNHGLKVKWLNSHTAVIGNEHSLARIKTGDVNLHVLPLKHIPSISVAKALETVVSSYKIRYDFKTNEIAVMANSLELRNIKELIELWDRDLPLINMEIKVVEVTADFLRAVGLKDSSSVQMKVYPLTKRQMAMIAENTGRNLLARQEVTSFHKQQKELFFGDQIPVVSEESKAESVNYQIANVDVGTRIEYSTRIDRKADTELIVRLQVGVTSFRKQGADRVAARAIGKGAGRIEESTGRSTSNTRRRKIKTTVGLKPGETIMLTGALNRSEFLGMKTPLYEFSFLSSLFSSEQSEKAPDPKKAAATIIFMTPTFTEKLAYKTPPAENTKKEISRRKPILESGAEKEVGAVKEETTNIPYVIRRKDTLNGISRKFGVSVQSIIKANKLKNPGIIKTNNVLMIPIPNERIYILKYKETVWRLAKRYGTTVEILKDLNGIKDVTKIRTGHKLVLPVPAAKIVNPKF